MRTFAIAAACLLLCGCGSYFGIQARCDGIIDQVYEPTVVEIAASSAFITGNTELGFAPWLGMLGFVDTPMTFVTDTVFLPVDIPMSIRNIDGFEVYRDRYGVPDRGQR